MKFNNGSIDWIFRLPFPARFLNFISLYPGVPELWQPCYVAVETTSANHETAPIR